MDNLGNEAIAVFFPGMKVFLEPLHAGLINRSFKATVEDGRLFFLQLINDKVFPQVGKIQSNYLLIYGHLKKYQPEICPPEPLIYAAGKTLFTDSENNHWRCFEWIDNTITIPVVHSNMQVKEVAKTFGQFSAAFQDHFDMTELSETIPHFHDLSLRYQQFEMAVSNNPLNRSRDCPDLIDGLLSRKRYYELFKQISYSEHFPRRVLHHDAKISNILFDRKSGRVRCVVDMDTTMPGLFFSDIGDMIRSMTCSIDEQDQRIDSLFVIKENYHAIIEGYLSQMGSLLTNDEHQLIHASGLLMTYMQALRYLTDYLNGDIYYQINYTAQNLNRASNQYTLLAALEKLIEQEYSFAI